jgi:hypothetical protein
MALVTIQSDSVTADVVRGVIVRPLVGVWTADLTIDQPNGLGFAAGAKVTIESQDGFSLALLTTNLSAWSVKAEPMSYALLTLLGWVSASLNWRILSDGTLWVGTESWPSASVTYDLLSHDPREAAYELGLQSPALEPGTTVDGIGKISRAEISISAEAIRARVWTPTDDPDRSTNADLDALISQKTSHVDYYALYVFQVVSQSADLSTVDISPVGDRNKALLGGMQRVTARYLTGIQVQVAPGSTCLLGWDGGNPEGPFALILSGDSALKIQLGGAHPLPLWDSFESALNTFINMFSGASPIVVVATGIPSPALVSAAQTIQALLTSHALESQIVSNG